MQFSTATDHHPKHLFELNVLIFLCCTYLPYATRKLVKEILPSLLNVCVYYYNCRAILQTTQ